MNLNLEGIEFYLKKFCKSLYEVQPENVCLITASGSFLRKEFTIIDNNIVSDLDMFVVVKFLNPLKNKESFQIKSNYDKILPFKIDLAFIPLKDFKKNKSLGFYETKAIGKVLYGNAHFLECIKMNDPSDIPYWEGIRLLFNRTFNLFKALQQKKVELGIMKAYLAIGETYLIFEKRYMPSYADRLLEIQNYCDYNLVDNFAEKFKICTEFKLNKRNDLDELSVENTVNDYLKSIDYFLSCYTNINGSLEDKIGNITNKNYSPYRSVLFVARNIKNASFRFNDLNYLFKEPMGDMWLECINALESNYDYNLEEIILRHKLMSQPIMRD